jgi:uncharacterized protein
MSITRPRLGGRAGAFVNRAFVDRVPRDHRQDPRDLRRRQIVTIIVVLVGAGVLGVLLRLEPGSVDFYVASLILAGVWAVGAFASGPLHLGRIASRSAPSELSIDEMQNNHLVRPVVTPLAIGFGLALVFVLGGLVVREIPWLDRQVTSVLDFADAGLLPLLIVVTAVNGIAEELFFRGAAYAAITRRPVLWTSIAYVIATAATGNIMLAFAAILLGVLCGLERRASGGILAPILTHCAWSLSMLIALPLLFNA